MLHYCNCTFYPIMAQNVQYLKLSLVFFKSLHKVLLIGQIGLEEGVFAAGPVICSASADLSGALDKLSNKLPPLLKVGRENGTTPENETLSESIYT